MDILDKAQFPGEDYQSLVAFIEHCRKVAIAKNKAQLASITLSVRHIAPLAVLQSIYAEHERHFYLERFGKGEAVAGADSVASFTTSGKNRFSESQAFADELFANAIAIGDSSAPFFGPHIFAGFTFEEAPVRGAPFAGATLFVPRWQVARKDGRYSATANMRVDPVSDPEQLAQRVWQAFEEFIADDYEEPLPEDASCDPFGIANKKEGIEEFTEAVETALVDIGRRILDKIVLARFLEIHHHKLLDPLNSLNTLRVKYPDCFAFSMANGEGRSFIGATPERVLKRDHERLYSDSIAGSIGRSEVEAEDRQRGEELLQSRKNLREHYIVRDFIMECLREAGCSPVCPAKPRLLPLSNVQHLHTPIEADCPQGLSTLQLLGSLHATPAVSGLPRQDAIDRIADFETFERGLYAGSIGWLNGFGDAEFVVGLRSALIDRYQARLYAGAGIVEGSDPEQEVNETDMKLEALLSNLR